jgi:hypothetical protein
MQAPGDGLAVPPQGQLGHVERATIPPACGPEEAVVRGGLRRRVTGRRGDAPEIDLGVDVEARPVPRDRRVGVEGPRDGRGRGGGHAEEGGERHDVRVPEPEPRFDRDAVALVGSDASGELKGRRPPARELPGRCDSDRAGRWRDRDVHVQGLDVQRDGPVVGWPIHDDGAIPDGEVAREHQRQSRFFQGNP